MPGGDLNVKQDAITRIEKDLPNKDAFSKDSKLQEELHGMPLKDKQAIVNAVMAWEAKQIQKHLPPLEIFNNDIWVKSAKDSYAIDQSPTTKAIETLLLSNDVSGEDMQSLIKGKLESLNSPNERKQVLDEIAAWEQHNKSRQHNDRMLQVVNEGEVQFTYDDGKGLKAIKLMTLEADKALPKVEDNPAPPKTEVEHREPKPEVNKVATVNVDQVATAIENKLEKLNDSNLDRNSSDFTTAINELKTQFDSLTNPKDLRAAMEQVQAWQKDKGMDKNRNAVKLHMKANDEVDLEYQHKDISGKTHQEKIQIHKIDEQPAIVAAILGKDERLKTEISGTVNLKQANELKNLKISDETKKALADLLKESHELVPIDSISLKVMPNQGVELHINSPGGLHFNFSNPLKSSAKGIHITMSFEQACQFLDELGIKHSPYQ